MGETRNRPDWARDFPFTNNAAPAPDPLLALLVHAYVKGFEVGDGWTAITVVADGVVISGKLIRGREYIEATVQRLRDGLKRAGVDDPEGSPFPGEAGAPWAEDGPNLSQYIHLRDVGILSGDDAPFTAPYWRVSLAAVTSWDFSSPWPEDNPS